jgi:O-antigen/teichoic acid export membrane protein
MTDDPAASSHLRLQKKINRGLAWTAASQTIVAVADLVSQLLCVSLWMTDHELGLAMLAVPFYTALDVVADFGVTGAIIQRDDNDPAHISTVFWFNMFVSLGLFAVLLVIGPLYGRLMGYAVVGWMLIAYGGKLILQNVYAIPYALLRREMRFDTIAKIRTVAYLGESVSRVAFAAGGITVWCFTLAALTKAVLFAILVQIVHPFVPQLVFRFREVRHYITFGMRNAASQVLYYVYTNLDYPLVGYYFGSAANGIYALAYWIVLEAVKTIANVVIDIAFPAFSRLKHDHDRLVAQFIRLTRMNLMAVLPFVVLILLIVPDFLDAAYGGGHWSAEELHACAIASRILCVVGLFRALGFIGPPLLDGIGRPELTLRYMVAASIIVPGCFLLFANLLGDRIGLLSVAVGWAVGYPIAFAILIYLIVVAAKVPLGAYLRGGVGIIACGIAGLAVGLVVSLVLPSSVGPGLRMIAIGTASLGTMFVLLAYWQNLGPRAIAAAMKSD